MNLIHAVGRLPLPKGLRLAWQRRLIDRAFRRELADARRCNESPDTIQSIESSHHFELTMIGEEEDDNYTRYLFRLAHRLRVPTPRMFDEGQKLTPDWEQGSTTGAWYLTETGVAKVREEIRRELRWRYERRGHWVAWLSGIVGILGALTGLVAVFRSSR